MEYRTLGNTEIKVSVIGLGTMTFGEQNSEAEGHEQIDYALDHAVNLIDTAEMYSVPPRAETYGSTERIIGAWFRKNRKRDKVVLCTKVAGPTHVLQADYLRGGQNRLDRKNILAAVEGSLQRLQTDYIDVYQLHWPDRATNFFGQLSYRHVESDNAVPIEETLERTWVVPRSIFPRRSSARSMRHIWRSLIPVRSGDRMRRAGYMQYE